MWPIYIYKFKEFLRHTYSLDHIHSWHKLCGCTFDRGSNFFAALEHFPTAIQNNSAPCVAHRHSTAVKNTCKHEECTYVKNLLQWARAFCKHILNHRLDEELFERIQLESGRTSMKNPQLSHLFSILAQKQQRYLLFELSLA